MDKYRYKYKIGTKINSYTISDCLGHGGNGEVYEVKNNKNEKFAMKILIISGDYREKYIRFKDEIKVVKEHQEKNEGILPIIEMEIPLIEDVKNSSIAWYVMPIATSINKVISKKVINDKHEFIKVLNGTIELAEIIKYFHNAGISHRDIKPGNIYYYNNKWVLSDFGLVDYPEKDNLTRNSLGPKGTIAPEMRLNAKKADGRKADVYSLGKTLWILITNNVYAFDGVYSSDTKAIRLNDFIDQHIYVKPLENLLEKATQQEPNERIEIDEFIKLLQDYIDKIDKMGRTYTKLDLESKSEEQIKKGLDGRVFHQQNNVLHEKEKIMEELFLNMHHNEVGFIELGYEEEIRILKTLTYKLAVERDFIVSPIFRYARNKTILNIAVYINYSSKYIKKVCNILCYKEKTNEITIDVFGNKFGTIKYTNDIQLNDIVDYTERISVVG